jgi:hypothetical protein
MCCSEKTVYFHLDNTCRKMRCRDYHAILGRLLSFSCQTLGHTPPEFPAFVDPVCDTGKQGSVAQQARTPPKIAPVP